MAKLSGLLAQRSADPIENNLEDGEIFFFGHSVTYDACREFCFCAKAPGTAIIEAIGPGGSSAKMCCCGGGLPGNSGAYVKKTITMAANQYVCGCLGKACNDADALCFRGCSAPTMLCWISSTADGCMCAEGGLGGCTTCNPNTAASRCFRCNNFCHTVCGFDNQPECGLVCNIGNGRWCGLAYGGDVNKPSNIGCVTFYCCSNGGWELCRMVYHVPMAPGFYNSEEGTIVQYTPDWDSPVHLRSGSGAPDFIQALQAAHRSPNAPPRTWACWNGRYYGCYNVFGCGHWLPFGTGGPPPATCCNVRDHATFGGAGAVRVKFIES